MKRRWWHRWTLVMQLLHNGRVAAERPTGIVMAFRFKALIERRRADQYAHVLSANLFPGFTVQYRVSRLTRKGTVMPRGP